MIDRIIVVKKNVVTNTFFFFIAAFEKGPETLTQTQRRRTEINTHEKNNLELAESFLHGGLKGAAFPGKLAAFSA